MVRDEAEAEFVPVKCNGFVIVLHHQGDLRDG
jgi:hypothetical protein